jgi:hypothetical protein
LAIVFGIVGLLSERHVTFQGKHYFIDIKGIPHLEAAATAPTPAPAPATSTNAPAATPAVTSMNTPAKRP